MKQEINKIIFIHSLNNFTSSPNVLSVIIKGFVKRGYKTELYTSKTEGFLSDLDGVAYHYTSYKWTDNKMKTFFLLMISQVQLFFRILFKSSPNAIFYINTIVPFGAALACWLSGKSFVYHVHENMQQNKFIYTIFRNVYKAANRKSIFVSKYLKKTAVNCRRGKVIYNALNSKFLNEPKNQQAKGNNTQKHILMVASLRHFKGIYEFAELAKHLPEYSFKLVLSASENEVNQFVKETGQISNLRVYPAQKNLHPFYQEAHLLLQLSHPELWIETFGLTILEAMVYGVPAIVPHIGGPTELVEHGKNGYHVNPHDLNDVATKINWLMENEDVYKLFSTNAIKKSKQFSEQKMLDEIENYLFT